MARSLRHVLVGSLIVSAAAVVVAAWLAFAITMTPTPVAAVTLSRSIVAGDQPTTLVQESSTSTAEPADAAGSVAITQRAPSAGAALLATAAAEGQPARQTASSAIESAANSAAPGAVESGSTTGLTTARQQARTALLERAAAREDTLTFVEPMRGLSRPPTLAEEHAAFVARAAARGDRQPFIEPMRGLNRPPTRAEEHAALVARAAARGDRQPFIEPMRGLSRPPTRAEENAAIVARAAERVEDFGVVEASYPIDAGVLQTPMLQPGDIVEATISFYYCVQGDTPEGGDGGEFCGVMRDGTVVYDGAAACAWGYLGQRFVILGDPLERVYTCADTGSAVHGLHRDIWFHTAAEGWQWQSGVGTRGLLLIVD